MRTPEKPCNNGSAIANASGKRLADKTATNRVCNTSIGLSAVVRFCSLLAAFLPYFALISLSQIPATEKPLKIYHLLRQTYSNISYQCKTEKPSIYNQCSAPVTKIQERVNAIIARLPRLPICLCR